MCGKHVITFDSIPRDEEIAALRNDSPLAFFIMVFYKQAICPKSQYYLPKLLIEQGTYEPYIVGDWSPNGLQPEGVASDNICALTNPPGTSPGYSDPDKETAVTFKEMQVAGLANVMPDVPRVDGDVVTTTARFSTLKDLPPAVPEKITITGKFEISQPCTTTDENGKDRKYTTKGNGSFSATITASGGLATILFKAEKDYTKLAAEVQRMEFQADLTSDNFCVSVDIENIPQDEREVWNNYVDSTLSNPDALKSFVDIINSIIGSCDAKRQFSDLLTTNIQKYIDELNGKSG